MTQTPRRGPVAARGSGQNRAPSIGILAPDPFRSLWERRGEGSDSRPPTADSGRLPVFYQTSGLVGFPRVLANFSLTSPTLTSGLWIPAPASASLPVLYTGSGLVGFRHRLPTQLNDANIGRKMTCVAASSRNLHWCEKWQFRQIVCNSRTAYANHRPRFDLFPRHRRLDELGGRQRGQGRVMARKL